MSGPAPWPIGAGFKLRAARLLEALASTWDITLVVGAAQDPAAIPISRVDLIQSAFEGPWRATPRRPRAFDALRADVRAALGAARYDAALLCVGTEVVRLGQDGFPRTVADRVDCGTLDRARFMRWARDARVLSGALDCARSLGYERRLVREADATTVVGEDDARMLRRITSGRTVHVVRNGVHCDTEPDTVSESRVPTVVFSGSLFYWANIDAARWFARRLWPAVRRRVPDARFLVVGRQPNRRVVALERLPGVELLPDVDDMAAVLRSAWLAVAPMRTGVGVKNKILEAWAVGRPAITTRLGANGIHLGPGTSDLVVGDGSELVDRTVELLVDRDLRRERGRAAWENARTHHTWDSAGRTMSRLLEGQPAESDPSQPGTVVP